MDPLRIVEYVMMFVILFYTICILFLFLKNRYRLHSSSSKCSWEPTVSVVIPAHNEEKNIGNAINSLLTVDYPKKKLEIIVVDDGSTDRTADVVKSFRDSRIILLQKKNEGNAAFAKNFGIRRAKGDVIITLDADSTVTQKSIKNLLTYFDDDIAAVTAAVKVKEKRKMSFVENLQKVEYLFTIFNRRLFSFINSVWVTPGPLSAFRKEIFDRVGLFDTNTIMEDQEIALRIQSANYKIASCTDAVVFTSVPRNLKGLYSQRLRWNRGGIRNILHYRHLAGLRYGDFGAFIMPISIISIGLLVAVLLIVAASMTKVLTPPNFDILLAIEPIHIFSFFILALTILWTWISMNELNAKMNPFYLIAYVILYCYMISFFTIVALAKEIKREPVRW